MWDTLSNTECKQIRSHSCRRHLNSTDEIQGDSFIKVTVGSVEGQNLHNLWNNNTSKKKKRPAGSLILVNTQQCFFFSLKDRWGKRDPPADWTGQCRSETVPVHPPQSFSLPAEAELPGWGAPVWPQRPLPADRGYAATPQAGWHCSFNDKTKTGW